MSIKFRILFLCLVLLPLAGCLLQQHLPSPEETFRRASSDFTQRLRWQDYQGAARHFSEPRRDYFLKQFKGQKDLHITEVRLESADYLPDEKRMDSTIMIEYYLLPSVVVKTFRCPLQWDLFPSGEYQPGEWRITSVFPSFPGAATP